MIPPKLKTIINKIIVFSFKNHWLGLLILAGFMYLSGKVMAEPEELFFVIPRNYYRLVKELHELFGKLILISAIFLAAQKVYLLLVRKFKI